MKKTFAFEIIERPDGQFTLRHYKNDQTNDHGPFSSKEEAEKGMTRIITPTIYRYSAIGAPLD